MAALLHKPQLVQATSNSFIQTEVKSFKVHFLLNIIDAIPKKESRNDGRSAV
jgi:hypothetical protein